MAGAVEAGVQRVGGADDGMLGLKGQDPGLYYLILVAVVALVVVMLLDIFGFLKFIIGAQSQIGLVVEVDSEGTRLSRFLFAQKMGMSNAEILGDVSASDYQAMISREFRGMEESAKAVGIHPIVFNESNEVIYGLRTAKGLTTLALPGGKIGTIGLGI